MANMSAIYEYLGANPDSIPILWLAAPLTGLLVQPIIGHMSDNTWTRLGRRRPYFLIGTIFAVIALFGMPYSGSLFMAAGFLWILDTSVNVSMEPFRAFVADMLPGEQRTVGYSVQTIFVSIGAVAASCFPWLLTNLFGVASPEMATGNAAAHVHAVVAPAHGASHHVLASFPVLDRILDAFQNRLPYVIKVSFHVGAAVYLACVLWTILTVKEYPPEDMAAFKEMKKKRGGAGKMFRAIFHDLWHMPQTMRELAWVQFFSWMALFCMWMYFPVTVGHLFGPKDSQAYLEGVEWAGICFGMYNVVSMLYCFLMPKIADKISRKGAHMVSLFIGAAGLLGILVVHSQNQVQLKIMVVILMVLVGIAWGSILTMPYAILSTSIPKSKMGIYMGIFNFFITIPQITVALGFGWVMGHVFHNTQAYGVAFGGCCWVVAALLMLRVTDRGAQTQVE